jgi:hypothetical protein
VVSVSEVDREVSVVAQAALVALEYLSRSRESGYFEAVSSLHTTIAAYETARAEYVKMLQVEHERARENEAFEVLARLEAILAVRAAVVAPPEAPPVTVRAFEDVLVACAPWWGLAVGGTFGIIAFRVFTRSVAFVFVFVFAMIVVAMLIMVTKPRVLVRRTLTGAVLGLIMAVFIALTS